MARQIKFHIYIFDKGPYFEVSFRALLVNEKVCASFLAWCILIFLNRKKRQNVMILAKDNTQKITIYQIIY